MWIAVAALIVVVGACAIVWAVRRRVPGAAAIVATAPGAAKPGGGSAPGSAVEQGARIDDRVRHAWGGHWTGVEIFSEHCRVRKAALGLAEILVSCLRGVGAPVVVGFAGPREIGVDSSGKAVQWGFAIHLVWPDPKEVGDAVAVAIEQSTRKNEGHGSLSFSERGRRFSSIDEAVEWCDLGGENWRCNLDSRPTAEQQRALTVREVAPVLVLEGRFVAVSGDGTTIVTLIGSQVSVWDAVSAERKATCGDPDRAVDSVAVSPQGRTAVTTSISTAGGETASVWDTTTGAARFSLAGHHEWIWGARFSPDGTWIVTASKDKTAKVWDAQTGRLLRTFDQGGEARCVAVFPDGRRVATGSAADDPDVKVWDAESGQLLVRLAPRTRYLRQFAACAVSSDGARVIGASTGTGDHLLHVWDVESGQELLVIGRHTSLITSVAVSPNGKYVLTGCYDQKARLFDLRSGAQLLELPIPAQSRNHVTSVAFSQDGGRLLVANQQTGVRIWAASALGLNVSG